MKKKRRARRFPGKGRPWYDTGRMGPLSKRKALRTACRKRRGKSGDGHSPGRRSREENRLLCRGKFVAVEERGAIKCKGRVSRLCPKKGKVSSKEGLSTVKLRERGGRGRRPSSLFGEKKTWRKEKGE